MLIRAARRTGLRALQSRVLQFPRPNVPVARGFASRGDEDDFVIPRTPQASSQPEVAQSRRRIPTVDLSAPTPEFEPAPAAETELEFDLEAEAETAPVVRSTQQPARVQIQRSPRQRKEGGDLQYWTLDDEHGDTHFYASLNGEAQEISEEDYNALQDVEVAQLATAEDSKTVRVVNELFEHQINKPVKDEVEFDKFTTAMHPLDFARATEEEEAFEFGTRKSTSSGGYYDILRPDSSFDSRQRFVYSERGQGARFREHTSEVIGYEPEMGVVGQDKDSIEWRALELYYAPQSVRERAAEAAVQLWLHEQRTKPTEDAEELAMRDLEDLEDLQDDVQWKYRRGNKLSTKTIEQTDKSLIELREDFRRGDGEAVIDALTAPAKAIRLDMPRDLAVGEIVKADQAFAELAQQQGESTDGVDWINGQALEIFSRAEQIVDEDLSGMGVTREDLTDTELSEMRSAALDLALGELQRAPPESVDPAVFDELQRKYVIIHRHMSEIAVARLDAIRKRHLMPPQTLDWYAVAEEASDNVEARNYWATSELQREVDRAKRESNDDEDEKTKQRLTALKTLRSPTVDKLKMHEELMQRELDSALGKGDPEATAHRQRIEEKTADPRTAKMDAADRRLFEGVRDAIADVKGAKTQRRADGSVVEEMHAEGSVGELRKLQSDEDEYQTAARAAPKDTREWHELSMRDHARREAAQDQKKSAPPKIEYSLADFTPYSREYSDAFMVFHLLSRRTTQQTGKGKIHGFYSLCVVGNGAGLVGVGEARDMGQPINSRRKAVMDAFRNMDSIDRFEKRTIWTEIQDKVGAVRLVMRPRPVGFGLQCNPYIHQVRSSMCR